MKRFKEKFEDAKRVIKSRKLKTNKQHNGQKKRDKRTNNDEQNNTQHTKDPATGTPLNTGLEL
jgi:hypothetical protein